MQGGTSSADLQQLRKELSKLSPEVLLTSEIVGHAVTALSVMPGKKDILNYLSLALVLSRQLHPALSAAGPPSQLTDLLHKELSPNLQQDGTLSKVLRAALGSDFKPQQSRSTDVLAALGRLSHVLPQPSTSGSTPINILIPFLLDTIRSGVNTKSNLLIINTLLPHVPTSSIPRTLLDDLVQEMYATDLGSYRGSIITQLLVRNIAQRGGSGGDEREELKALLPLFGSSQPPITIIHANRYLFPNLFTARPSAVHTLLSLLSDTKDNTDESEASFRAWISVASLGVSLGHLQISDLPKDILGQAIVHFNPDVRLQAFKLVAGTQITSSEGTLLLVQESLRWNAVLSHAGSRSELSSAFHAFVTRLKMSEAAIARNSTETELTSTTSQENHLAAFHRWFLHDLVDSGISNAQRPPVVRALLSLNLLAVYVDIFSTAVQKQVYTAERVSALLACQASEFTEVRNRARGILAAAQIPLPGYETLDSPAATALLSSALSSISHPRKVQAEAGKAALCILFERLVRTAADESQDEPIHFVTRRVDQLEDHIVASEKDLVKGIEEYPLHGVIAALQDVLSCTHISSLASQTAWKPIFHRIFSLIQRIWSLTRQVVSLAPNGPDNPPDQAGRAEHEIARAYEMIGGEDGVGDEVVGGDYAGLLSGCWRATSQAGDLLATIISLPYTQSGQDQTIWSIDEVDAAGHCFLTWLHEIRHRGTFSKIAVAFANVVTAIRPYPEVSNLRDQWLDVELQIIADESISTTRRSAALPYSVLAIVSTDQVLLDKAFEALLDLARIDSTSTDVTKVHAFNILKIVLLDAKQSKFFARYFEKAVITALEAFASPNWNVRNVGLILFSTLVHRSLTPNRGNPDFFQSRAALATRYTLHEWDIKYPTLIPHLRGHLRDAKAVNMGGHSPLFPILIILRSLKWCREGEVLAGALKREVRPFLGSKEWQVRAVAAQAFSSLLSPEDALKLVLTPNMQTADLNSQHGELQLIRHLISDVINWSDVGTTDREKIEVSLIPNLNAPSSSNTSVQTAAIECAKAYLDLTAYSSSFKSSIAEYLALQRSITSQKRYARPGQGLWEEAKSQLLLSVDPSEDSVLSLLRDDASEDERLSCLEYLMSSDAPLSVGIGSRLLDLGVESSSGTAVQVAALEVLCDKAHGPSQADITMVIVDRLSVMLSTSACVPLREAALNALGWVIASALQQGLDVGGSVATLVITMTDASDIYKSQPSRNAALQALSHLTPILYKKGSNGLPEPVLGLLHRLVLRLLQDDDDEIRENAAEIVQKGLGVVKGICQAKAVELEWMWIGDYLNADTETVQWMMEVCLDETAFESNLTILSGTSTPNKDVLFEVEQPNIFRDPHIDMGYAARILATKNTTVTSKLRDSITKQRERLTTAITACATISPIDQAYEARNVLLRRQDAQAVLKPEGIKE